MITEKKLKGFLISTNKYQRKFPQTTKEYFSGLSQPREQRHHPLNFNSHKEGMKILWQNMQSLSFNVS